MIISVKYMWKGRSIFILIPPRLPYGWVSTADEPLGIHFQREGVRKFFSNGSNKNVRWYESAHPERGRGGGGGVDKIDIYHLGHYKALRMSYSIYWETKH